MFISLLAALIGFVLTGTQAALIYLQGSGICLNEGCEIVDSLTRVEPFYINIFGFFFFLIAAIGLNRARKGSELWRGFISLLLLAALSAEAVLFSFQLFITRVFCSYCLIILAIVVICNLFMGLKQLFKGIVIFSAVVLAMASLNFSAEQAAKLSLENGTIARFRSDASNRQLYLFFSSSCVHCENIMDDLQDGTTCSFNFNPIDRVEEFTFPGSVLSEKYDPSINRGYLKHLDIRGVPVLLEKRADGVTLLRGETAISEFLVQYCTEPAQNEMSTLMGQISEQTTSAYPVATQPLEDGCSITEECEDQSSPYTAQ